MNPAYKNDPAALIYPHGTGPVSSVGLTIADDGFLTDAGDGIIFGHNNVDFAIVTDNMGTSAGAKRWTRIWQLDVRDQGSNGGRVTLTFDISDLGGAGVFDPGGSYYLLMRASGSSDDFVDVVISDWSVSGDRLTFTVDISQLVSGSTPLNVRKNAAPATLTDSSQFSSEFTLGASAGTPTAVRVLGFKALPANSRVYLVGILAGLVVSGSILVIRKRQ